MLNDVIHRGVHLLSPVNVSQQALQCVRAQSIIGTNDGTGQLLILSYKYDIKLAGHSLAS